MLISSSLTALVALAVIRQVDAVVLDKRQALAKNVILTSPGKGTKNLPISSGMGAWCDAMAPNSAPDSYQCDVLNAIVQCTQIVFSNSSTANPDPGTNVAFTVTAQCGELQ